MALVLGLVAPVFSQKVERAGVLAPEAREQLRLAEDTLAILAFAITNDTSSEMRFLACKSLITGLVRALKTENSFRYPFERLKSVSILTPPDSSFRIFTWQLFVNDSTYRHYGAIQMNQRELKLFPLIDRRFELSDMPTREALPPNRWYGAVYYNLRPFETRRGRMYLLFGLDGHTFFEKRKVMDVLSFDAKGEPVLGAPVFERNGQLGEHRLILEYSAEAKVRLNWDDYYKMVLFDHLIPWPSPHTAEGITHVPDGSYDGFKLEKGRWVFVEKVFRDSQEEAPRPYPVLDEKDRRDLLGRPPKAKGQRR
ncbi:MAG: hypothetical protein RMJ33_01395 [Saprospiraceae bacterium]|nr:hypothetical protein [Saprospiraceae bacterium]MDW8228465.1 hypothetical protein [Saprospiraceae bacterium]